MKDELIRFLRQFPDLTENEIAELSDEIVVDAFKKNEVIVSQGQYCNLCYFVLKGCLRQYVIVDGIEKTIALYVENQAVNYFTNQTGSKPSENYLSCIEDSILLVGNPSTDRVMYEKYPQLMDITRKILETDLGRAQASFARFIISSPEERYVNLVEERPELLQRVPQHIIASFLGMTAESLSRIKKRIHKK